MADDFMESAAPYFRQSDTQLSSTIQRICALLILLPLPVVHYGWRALLTVIFGILAAVAAEALWNLAAKHKQTLSDMTAVETGLACALLMPARAHYQLAIFAAASAMVIGKLPFGGRFRTPFIPAAVGCCLSAVCFPAEMFTYSQISSRVTAELSVFGSNSALTPAFSQIALLREGKLPAFHVGEFLLVDVDEFHALFLEQLLKSDLVLLQGRQEAQAVPNRNQIVRAGGEDKAGAGFPVLHRLFRRVSELLSEALHRAILLGRYLRGARHADAALRQRGNRRTIRRGDSHSVCRRF